MSAKVCIEVFRILGCGGVEVIESHARTIVEVCEPGEGMRRARFPSERANERASGRGCDFGRPHTVDKFFGEDTLFAQLFR